MKHESPDPKRVDRIARGFCIAAVAVTAFLAYAARSSSLQFMFWGFAVLSFAFLLAATIAPSNLRSALVAWFPWF